MCIEAGQPGTYEHEYGRFGQFKRFEKGMPWPVIEVGIWGEGAACNAHREGSIIRFRLDIIIQ